MRKHATNKLRVLRRTSLIQGNKNGVVANVQVTVCQDGRGRLLYIHDNPDELPLVNRYLNGRRMV